MGLERNLALLTQVPFFAGFEASDCRELAGRAQIREVPEGTAVVRQGDEGASLFVVESGRLKVEARGGPADPVILDIFGPGEVFGELAVLTRRPRAADVVALEPCVLLCVDYRDVRAAIERSPRVALALLANLANRVIGFGELVRAFAVSGLEPRLARRICALAAAHGARRGAEVVLDLRLTQSDWALMSGASREAVNRQFRAWSTQGLVAVEGSSLRILDPEGLRKLADAAGLFSE